MLKVTNKMDDVRRFRDTFTGTDVLVGPKQSVLTSTPVKSSDVWSVRQVEKKEVDKKSIKDGENNDRSRSR